MNLSALDLNLLVVLHTVLEQKSVVRAAAKLHVTPPAVSNALSRLRDVLRDPLLVRRGRGLVPTPRALELAPRVASALGELERALGDGGFEPATTRRRFVLACSDGDQIASVPRIAKALAERMPHAQLHVVSIDQLAATDGLAAGTVDVALSPVGVPTHDLHTQPVYGDEGVIVVRAAHPLRGRRLSRQQFNRLQHVDVWLFLGRAGVGNRLAEAHFERHGMVRQVAVIVPGFSAAAMVAASTDLAAGMPRRVAEHLARHLPLRVLTVAGPPMRVEMQMVWHARTHHDPGAVLFRALIAEAVCGKSARSARGRARRGSTAG